MSTLAPLFRDPGVMSQYVSTSGDKIPPQNVKVQDLKEERQKCRTPCNIAAYILVNPKLSVYQEWHSFGVINPAV
jgi:hypothetical protein